MLSDWRRHTPTVIYFTILLSFFFNPLVLELLFGVHSFDRTIDRPEFGLFSLSNSNEEIGNFLAKSNGAIGSYALHPETFGVVDPSLRSIIYFTYFLIFIPISFFISVLFCRWFTKQYDTDDLFSLIDIHRFLNSISICALASSLFLLFNKFNIPNINSSLTNFVIQLLPCSIIVFTLVYYKYQMISFEKFRYSIYLSLALSLFFIFGISQLIPYSLNFSSLKILIFIFSFIISECILIYLFWKNPIRYIEKLRLSLIPIFFGMLFAGLTLELCNILNQHEIFITHRYGLAFLVYCAMIILALILYLSRNQIFNKIFQYNKAESLSLIGLLLSIAYFSALPPLQITAGMELFGQSNSEILVNDTLLWNKFPIINSFDPHTMSISTGRLLYGFLNNDIIGASYFGYSFLFLLVIILLSYVFFKLTFNQDFSFFFILLVPAFSSTFASFGLLNILAFYFLIRNQDFKSYFFLFCSIFLTMIYKFDEGFTYGSAVFLIILASLIRRCHKEKILIQEAKTFLKSLIMFLTIVITLIITICLVQNINPLMRTLEFVGLTNSSNNWNGYVTHDPRTVQYAFLYHILPLICTFCLFFSLIRLKNNLFRKFSIVVLGAFFLHFTRLLARHCLADNIYLVGNHPDDYFPNFLIWTSCLGLSFFVSSLLPKFKQAAFVFSGLFLFTLCFQNPGLLSEDSIFIKSLNIYTDKEHYYEGKHEKIKRVDLSAPLKQYSNVLAMINQVIPQHQTYIDLSSHSILYALSGREKPVYTDQSPSHLSGEFTQDRFILEVETFKGTCDFALLHDTGKGDNPNYIPDSYVYYKIYEYLYEHYQPLSSSSDGFSLWVKKSRYDQFDISKFNHVVTPIDYYYYGKTHSTDLRELPYIWGQYDTKKSWANEIIPSDDFDIVSGQTQSKAKYALLTIDTGHKGNCALKFQNLTGDDVSIFSFNVYEGNHRYILRVSADWFWNNQIIQTYSTDCDVDVNSLDVKFLAGD
jgi:hypothetical protein